MVIYSGHTVNISWNDVVNLFRSQFDLYFESVSRKAHLDCADLRDKVIDGAKNKWCPILLLDAIVSLILDPKIRSQQPCQKRGFNQVIDFFPEFRKLT